MKKAVAICLLFLLSNFISLDLFAKKTIRLIPDKDIYQEFLLNEWKQGAASLIVIKDPSCPYCIRDLKKRSQLQNYNVFLFWAPILGEGSVTRVREYFQCRHPVGDAVIRAAIDRQAPRCESEVNQDLLDLNDQMVASYEPEFVPQYWLGGSKVSLSSLNLFRPLIHVDAIAKQSLLKIDWPRYQTLALNPPSSMRHNMAIVLPDERRFNLQALLHLSNSTQYNWYLFGNNLAESQGLLWCRRRLNTCDNQSLENGPDYYNKEFRLLTGLEPLLDPIFLLEGKILTEREKTYLIPKEIRGLTFEVIH